MTDRPTVEPAGVSPMRIDVEPSSLYITHICDGEEVVRGGEDGQVYIATFCSYYMAHFFVGQCNQLAGFVSGTIAPTSQPERERDCPAIEAANRIASDTVKPYDNAVAVSERIRASKDREQPSRGKNPHCPADGKPCAPDGKGECVACDDGKGDCAQPERPCICADPENCTEVPEGWERRCKRLNPSMAAQPERQGATTLRQSVDRIREFTRTLPTPSMDDEPTSPPQEDIVAPLHERIQGVYTRAGRAAVCGIPDDSHDCDQMACSSVEHILARVPHIVDEKPSPPSTDDIVAGLRNLRDDLRIGKILWPEERALLDRAIAALGEKGWQPTDGQRDALRAAISTFEQQIVRYFPRGTEAEQNRTRWIAELRSLAPPVGGGK